MFLVSDNNIITMQRGDCGAMTIKINLGDNINPDIYQLTSNDKVYFGVMEPLAPFENSLIKKTYTLFDLNLDDTLTITLDPKDTEYLLPGTYYYEVKLLRNTYVDNPDKTTSLKQYVYTFMPRRKFIIME